ncbi:MAG: hypothetical protein IJU00_09185 [Selenomonas sp.]|nr:hypothetical protein [Selenomonas sp.]
MLRLPKDGSHAAYKQLLSQRIHNSHLKRFDNKKRKLAARLLALDLSPIDEIMRPFLLRGRSSCMAPFLDTAFLRAFHLP